MVIIVCCFLVYFLSLILFSLTTHPIYYCGLLVFKAFISSLLCYCLFGFGWYSLLLCLVYIGGVYILFVFVSAFRPKKGFVFNKSRSCKKIFVLLFLVVTLGVSVVYCVTFYEFSRSLCTFSEGNFYICMCLSLVFGFIILSLVVRAKFNHYR